MAEWPVSTGPTINVPASPRTYKEDAPRPPFWHPRDSAAKLPSQLLASLAVSEKEAIRHGDWPQFSLRILKELANSCYVKRSATSKEIPVNLAHSLLYR